MPVSPLLPEYHSTSIMLLDSPRDSIGFNSKILNYPTEDIMMRIFTKTQGGNKKTEYSKLTKSGSALCYDDSNYNYIEEENE